MHLLYVNYLIITISRFVQGDSLQFAFESPYLYSGINLILDCEVIETEIVTCGKHSL